MSLPAADELFRRTVPAQGGPTRDEVSEAPSDEEPTAEAAAAARAPSGRVRHDEKMTVYVTAEELLELEQARITLRRLGLGVDRGRLVRAAIALALADLDERGEDSAVAHRLTQA